MSEEYWNDFDELIGCCFPELLADQGEPLGRIESLERQRGFRLPRYLRELYTRCGRRDDLLRSHDEFRALDSLVVEEDMLILARENQDACHWAIRRSNLDTDDPPVERMDNTDEPVWERDHDQLSAFIRDFVLWQAVTGGAPAGGNVETNESLVDRLSTFRELETPGSHWKDMRFFASESQLVCLVGTAPMNVFAAARTPAALTALAATLSIDWDYSWPEDEA